MTQRETEKACDSTGLSEMLVQYGSGFLKKLEKGRGATVSNQSTNNQPMTDISFPERRKRHFHTADRTRWGKILSSRG